MKQFIRQAGYVLGLHLLGLAGVSLLRVLQYGVCRGMCTEAGARVWPAFVRGLWLDNVIGCYITVLPLAVVLFCAVAGRGVKPARRFAAYWTSSLYSLVLLISAANIPYFLYFFKPLNSSIFGWFGYAGTTAGMLAGEWSYVLYMLLWLALAAAFWWASFRWERVAWRPAAGLRRPPVVWSAAVSLALIGLCVFGIRGRTGYNPIKVSQAYYCRDAMLNQLGISPTFNLLTSVLDDRRSENAAIELMDPREALAIVDADRPAQVARASGEREFTSSCERPDSLALGRRNVVVVLMESMSAGLLGPLTPTLDSLANHSIYFRRCYSAGVHTNHGLTATLYGFPALMKRNLMKGTVTPHRRGLPTELQRQGWHTMFFMPHEGQYDNMNAFFRTNGYDDVWAQEDYPSGEVVNAFGVPDKFLYEYALGHIRHSGEPFLATVLTVSNHPPYVLPQREVFAPRSKDSESAIVEYADWALGRFLAAARREPWYKRTVFVVLGDHGKIVGTPEAEVPESYNHIPLLIFGEGISPRVIDSPVSQVDVSPTLLGLLGLDGGRGFTRFGRDVLASPRRRVAYSADDQILARQGDTLLIYNHPARHTLLYIGGRQADAESAGARALRRYAFAWTQAAETLYRQEK